MKYLKNALNKLYTRFAEKIQLVRLPPEELAECKEIYAQYNGDWVDYEGYMKAGIVQAEPNKNGVLVIKFVKNTGVDKLGLHKHNYSDRQIVVLEGSGVFHYGEPTKSIAIEAGTYLQFPRGTVHTFSTNSEDMVVLSIHRPFIDLEDPKCLEMYENDKC